MPSKTKNKTLKKTIKSISQGFYAQNFRVRLESEHNKLIETLKSSVAKEDKDREMGTQLKSLINDFAEVIPSLKKPLFRYRKLANDIIYPPKNVNKDFDTLLKDLNEAWEKLDFRLAKMSYFSLCGFKIKYNFILKNFSIIAIFVKKYLN